VVALVVVIACRRTLRHGWRLHRTEALIAMVGAAIYVAGGAGLEVVGYELDTGTESTLDVVRIASEELLEMVGVTTILYAALRVLSTIVTERGRSFIRE
jgi:hypothetical protein